MISCRARTACLIGFAVLHLFTAARAEEAPPTVSEASNVAAAVLTHEDWRSLAARCPASLMPQRSTWDDLQHNTCQPGEFNACLARCTAGDAGACYWLASGLQRGGSPEPAAETLFQRSCQLGIVSGCTNRAAGMLYDHPDDEGTRVCAVETFAKGCDLEDPWACTMYGMHLSRGIGTKQDREHALKVLDKSCKYGPEDEACSAGMSLKKSLLTPPKAASQPG